jgi:truncated hemoglobin YjbI
VERLVQAFAADFVIGFLFEGKDLARIARHELELARAHLGGPAAYGGRPIGAAHGPLRINRGHFRRRLTILRHILTDEGVAEGIIEGWVAHDARLESVVTTGEDCVD